MDTELEPSGTPVLSALEAFYARDIDDLAAWSGSMLAESRARGDDVAATVAALRVDDFMTVYLEQIHSVGPDHWARSLPMPDGHLRSALLGRELVAVPRSGRLNMLMDGRLFGAERLPRQLAADHRELKAPLCYAHDVIFEDPFDDEHHALVQMRVIQREFPDTDMRPALEPDLFVRTVRALADLAPLIRAGTVMFVPRQLTAAPRSVAVAGSSIAGMGGEVSRKELAERTVRAWLLTGGRAVPLFASADEEAAFRDSAALLAPLLPEREGGFMRRLAALALPNSGRLDIRHMLEIREESLFQQFRTRQRAALAAVGDGEDATALRLYREEMRAAAADTNRRSGSGLMAKFTVPKAVGWLTGAMILQPGSGQAALAALGAITTHSAMEAWQERDKGARALHHHYATLGAPPAALAASDG
ncbi:hypothetical protein [Streptomyces sp. SP18CS02]|uniref:hypothetical protein n=1 Tax=Streptomyces sp. SP18CS02 TaxID=3002531 RepID=UPI002E79CE23|nr:hypothetical protein [Streptomyces sp. SP18CS02]MEE1752870.1 hypothetical protein [Streptomyces sp. SP18CS02]